MTTLYDYFSSLGQPLPSVTERRDVYGLGTDYTGTAAQNIALLQQLQGGQAPQQASQQAPTASPGGSLWSQYKPRLDPMTQRAEALLRDYQGMSAQAPTFQQSLLDAIKQSGQYPSHAAMREEYAANPNLTPMAIEGLVSQRGQSTRGSIQDLMGRATGGFESDVQSKRNAYESAQQQRQNLLEEYGLEYQSQQGERGAAGQAMEAERSAVADAQGGLNAEDFARKYGGQLDDWELINLYNKNSPYGAMKESPKTFKDWISDYEQETGEGLDQEAITAYASMINSGEITLSNVPADYRAEVTKIVSQEGGEEEIPSFWDRLKSLWQ